MRAACRIPACRTSWFALCVALCGAAIVRADEPAGGAPLTAEQRDAQLQYFESNVRPLFLQHCGECHSADAKILQGGLRLDTVWGIAQGGDGGAIVVPGAPEESRLYRALRYQDADLQMPPTGRLSDQQIADVAQWIAGGAVLPEATVDAAGPAQDAGPLSIEAGREFWSIRPLAVPAPPPVAQADWIRQPLDAYILANLEAAGLPPAAEADRRTLIRRLYFDLWGLPPEPEAVAAFVADPAPDAYERLVDELLASPHAAERVARRWLDLVRYCDVPESWAQVPADAWRYRDWVVQAVAQDLPYDEFVRRQLAADQLPHCTPEDLAALGLLGLSPTQWKELKLAPGVIQTVVAEEWEERINTLSNTFLGLSVSCARCHDHKFDPVTQEDYYALAGVLASTRLLPRPLVPPERQEPVIAAHAQIEALQAEITKLKATQPDSPERTEQVAALEAQIEQLKQTTPDFSAPNVYAVVDAGLHVLPDGPDRTRLEYSPEPVNVALQIRGNPLRTGAEIPRGFLAVLAPQRRAEFSQGSGRRELAETIFRDAAPLAARVMVNRVWGWHFGRGLVDTPSNFGVQGSRPTHPELLDDLAARFIAQGWSLRRLEREIVLSATYRQVSLAPPAALAADADNRLLSRAPRRRLEVEAWRDALLAIAGRLDRTVGGPPAELAEAGNGRRTLYGLVRRLDLSDVLRLFDFPDPIAHSPARIDTITPLQQLYVLNSEFLHAQATALAARVRTERPGDLTAQIERAYALAFGRPPTERELALGREFLTAGGAATAAAAPPEPTDAVWAAYAQVLLSSNELMFID